MTRVNYLCQNGDFLPASTWTKEDQSAWAASEVYDSMHSCWVPCNKRVVSGVKDL